MTIMRGVLVVMSCVIVAVAASCVAGSDLRSGPSEVEAAASSGGRRPTDAPTVGAETTGAPRSTASRHGATQREATSISMAVTLPRRLPGEATVQIVNLGGEPAGFGATTAVERRDDDGWEVVAAMISDQGGGPFTKFPGDEEFSAEPAIALGAPPGGRGPVERVEVPDLGPGTYRFVRQVTVGTGSQSVVYEFEW